MIADRLCLSTAVTHLPCIMFIPCTRHSSVPLRESPLCSSVVKKFSYQLSVPLAPTILPQEVHRALFVSIHSESFRDVGNLPRPSKSDSFHTFVGYGAYE